MSRSALTPQFHWRFRKPPLHSGRCGSQTRAPPSWQPAATSSPTHFKGLSGYRVTYRPAEIIFLARYGQIHSDLPLWLKPVRPTAASRTPGCMGSRLQMSKSGNNLFQRLQSQRILNCQIRLTRLKTPSSFLQPVASRALLRHFNPYGEALEFLLSLPDG